MGRRILFEGVFGWEGGGEERSGSFYVWTPRQRHISLYANSPSFLFSLFPFWIYVGGTKGGFSTFAYSDPQYDGDTFLGRFTRDPR